MNYAEKHSNARKIGVYLADAAGVAITGFTPSAGQLKVSLSGAATANGGGSWHELAAGAYVYTATQAETTTHSWLAVLVSGHGGDQFVWVEDIGDRVVAGEDRAAYLRMPVYLQDAAGTPVTGRDIGATTQLSINSAAFAARLGAVYGEAGQGLYYYQADPAEVAAEGLVILKVLDAASKPYLYAQGVLAGASESAADLVPIAAPYAPGDQLYRDQLAAALARLCEYSKPGG